MNDQKTNVRYSINDENYDHESVGDVLDELDTIGDLTVGRVYYEANVRELKASDFSWCFRIDEFLKRMDDDLYENVGEVSDCDFSSVPQEAKDELSALLCAWIDKHVVVGRYWKVDGKPRALQVTADDIAAMGQA